MEKAKINPTFRFSKYIINEAAMTVKDFAVSNELDIKINLTALFNPHETEDRVVLIVDLQDKNEKISIQIKLTGYFVSNLVDDDQRKSFICLNAPAILFPYVRAFISSMTSQAGIDSLVLPTINLHSYGMRLLEELKTQKD